jgi:hypothetical protein
MKTVAISSAVVLLCVGGVLGSDMWIDFPLFMRAPVPAAASLTNLNVPLSQSLLIISSKMKANKR